MRSPRRRIIWLIIGLLLIAISIWLHSLIGVAALVFVVRGLR